jgi:glucose-1-phosphate thymidylyltransferase
MIGIVLAGGTGSRLWPITKSISKQLLPVFDKPLIHYPISTLMLAGIRNIAIITTVEDQPLFKKALGNGELFGVHFEYFVQNKPAGLAEAFLITEKYIAGNECALILGDNLFHGVGLGRDLEKFQNIDGAQIFASEVSDPHRYGVVSFNQNGKAESLEEKPKFPKSSFAVPGLYFYDNQVFDIAKEVKPSERGELEITSVNEFYLSKNKLNVALLPKGTLWMDTGTFESLHEASSYVQSIQQRQGYKIACLEEIAFRKNWISTSDLEKIIQSYGQNDNAAYLEAVIRKEK